MENLIVMRVCFLINLVLVFLINWHMWSTLPSRWGSRWDQSRLLRSDLYPRKSLKGPGSRALRALAESRTEGIDGADGELEGRWQGAGGRWSEQWVAVSQCVILCTTNPRRAGGGLVDLAAETAEPGHPGIGRTGESRRHTPSDCAPRAGVELEKKGAWSAVGGGVCASCRWCGPFRRPPVRWFPTRPTNAYCCCCCFWFGFCFYLHFLFFIFLFLVLYLYIYTFIFCFLDFLTL